MKNEISLIWNFEDYTNNHFLSFVNFPDDLEILWCDVGNIAGSNIISSLPNLINLYLNTTNDKHYNINIGIK